MYYDYDYAEENPTPVQIALGVGGALALVGALIWATSASAAEPADALNQEEIGAAPPEEAQIEAIVRQMVGPTFVRIRNIQTISDSRGEGYLVRVEMEKSPKNPKGLGPQVEILVAFDYQTASIVKEIPEFDFEKYTAEGVKRQREKEERLAAKGYTYEQVSALRCPLLGATNDLLGILGELNNPAKRSSTFLASGRSTYAKWKTAYTNWWKGVQAIKSAEGYIWYTGARSRPNLVPNLAAPRDYYDMDSPDPSAALNKAQSALILGWSLGVPALVYKRETPSYGGVTGTTLLGEIEARSDTDGLNLMMALYDSYIKETGNRPGFYIKCEGTGLSNSCTALGYGYACVTTAPTSTPSKSTASSGGGKKGGGKKGKALPPGHPGSFFTGYAGIWK